MSSLKSLISSLLTTLSWLKKGSAANTPSPLLSIHSSDNSDTTSRICAVCLSGLEGETATCTRTLPCLHEFHAACIGKWLAVPHAKSTCPICRFQMGGDCRDGKGVKRQECFTEEMVIWFSSFHVAGF